MAWRRRRWRACARSQPRAGDFGLGILLLGVPLVLVGIWPAEWPALVLLTVVGVGKTIVDVAGTTLLQRGVPDAVLSCAASA